GGAGGAQVAAWPDRRRSGQYRRPARRPRPTALLGCGDSRSFSRLVPGDGNASARMPGRHLAHVVLSEFRVGPGWEPGSRWQIIRGMARTFAMHLQDLSKVEWMNGENWPITDRVREAMAIT